MMSLMLLCGSGGQPQTVLYTLVTVGIQGPQMKNSNFRESPLAHLTKGSIKCSSHQVAFRYRRLWFDLWVGKIPCGRKWQPAPVFLPGKFHGQRSLADYSPWGCKESDMTEQLNRNTHTQTRTHKHAHTQACVHTLRGHGSLQTGAKNSSSAQLEPCFPVTVLQLSNDLAPGMEENGRDIALQLTHVIEFLLSALHSFI